jgi:hypothetical protein
MNLIELAHRSLITKEGREDLKTFTEDDLLGFLDLDNITYADIETSKNRLLYIRDSASDLSWEYTENKYKADDGMIHFEDRNRAKKYNIYVDFWNKSQEILKKLLSCKLDNKQELIDYYKAEWLLYMKFMLLDEQIGLRLESKYSQF